MKTVIKIWGIPNQGEDLQRQVTYSRIYYSIINSVVSMDIGIYGDRDIALIIPNDIVICGDEGTIFVEIDSNNAKQRHITLAVASIIKYFFPKMRVQVKFSCPSAGDIVEHQSL